MNYPPPNQQKIERSVLPEEAVSTSASLTSVRPRTSVRILCVFLAVLPFLLPYFRHFTSPGIPTGFILYDMACYSAQGRAIFERGNGFAYPNPCDYDPKAPVIYFHWLIWILGFGITHLGFDPGLQFFVIGVLAGLVCSCFTLRLVEELTSDPQFRYALFFLVMWGGGILFLAQAILNIAQGRSLMNEPFAFDPCWGWWFLNWGRNMIYPQEAVYHAIVAATWFAVITQRRVLVVLGGVLLASTHPFSGLQLLLMLSAWYGILTCARRRQADFVVSLCLAVVLAAFLGYYMVYLNSFPSHRELENLMSLPWVLPGESMLLAYGPIALLALLRVRSDGTRLDDNACFFLTCFVVSLFLAKHEWFVSPRQPLHFTRGYIWTPLCFFALPYIQRILIRWRLRVRPLSFGLVVLAATGVAISDNVAFIGKCVIRSEGFHLTPDEAESLKWIDQHDLRGVLLCPDYQLSYLTSTYTKVRPFLGHHYNTPHNFERRQQVEDWLAQGKEWPWFEDIDYILLNKKEPSPRLPWGIWEVAFENSQLVLFIRKSQTDSTTSRLEEREESRQP